MLQQKNALTEYLDSLTQRGVPGCECIVYRGYEKIFHYRVNTAPRAMVWLFSASKVLTMTALAQLIESGKVALGDPVARFIPSFAHLTVQTPSGAVPAQNVMTVEHLMTMSGGLNYDLQRPALLEAKRRYGDALTTLQGVEALAKDPMDFEPGTHYQYSLCHDVAAAVVEVASGERFSDYVREHVLTPLDMRDVTFHPTDEQLSRIAPYYVQPEPYRAEEVAPYNEYRFSDAYESGGAGVFACAEDYAKLMIALANGGIGATGARILKEETIESMRLNRLHGGRYADFHETPHVRGYGYGLGVRTLVEEGESAGPLGEFGWDGAAGAMVFAEPSTRLSVTYFQQVRDCADVYMDFHRGIRDRVYRLYANPTEENT